MVQLQWEEISNPGSAFYYRRAKVPGGWLVECSADVSVFMPNMGRLEEGFDWRPAITYIPDPEYKWEVKNG
jgi:hypothetical protein